MATANETVRRRELIRDRLHIHRTSQAKVARMAGVSRSMVCHVIAGRKAHDGTQHALADVCGLTYNELWGD